MIKPRWNLHSDYRNREFRFLTMMKEQLHEVLEADRAGPGNFPIFLGRFVCMCRVG